MSQRPENDPPAVATGNPAVWLDVDLPSVEGHLALDEALLDEAHTARCPVTVVRTWMAKEHVIVLGSSCRIEEEVDPQACAANGVRILRRPSGGGTVMLGPGCLMWSVITHHPLGAPAIDRIHAAMLEPLAAAISDRTSRQIVRRGLSDLAIQAGDGERKVSGNALRVRRHGVLYHGTLLDSLDLELVSRVLRHPPREPDYRGRRTHRAFLTNLAVGRAMLEEAVRAAFSAETLRTDWPAAAVEQLIRDRYTAAAWIRRL